MVIHACNSQEGEAGGLLRVRACYHKNTSKQNPVIQVCIHSQLLAKLRQEDRMFIVCMGYRVTSNLVWVN